MGLFNSKQQQALNEAKRIREDLHKRVNNRLNEYQERINRIDPQKKKKILMSSATQIVQMLDQGTTTSQEILLSFIQRTATIGIRNNYVIDQLFQEALIHAIQCDFTRTQHKGKKCWRPGFVKEQCFPPFFGVPISVKESILMKGRQSYAGFVSKINPIPTEDPLIIHLVKNMGFIPFVRSNVPQGLKTLETNNNMFGYAKNAWNQTRSVGGSSGGQAGLVASYCSPIGLGSDIGGSLRVPADWNGLFTLKANGRVTKIGNSYYGKYAGGSTVRGALGFLSKSTSDLIITLSYMCDQQIYKTIPLIVQDPYLPIVKFNHDIFLKKPTLKIGYLTHLQTLNCDKAHQRAVNEAITILENQGHQIQKIKLPNFQKLYLFLIITNACDKNFSIFDQLKQHQPLIKQYSLLNLAAKIPWLIRRVIIYFIKKKSPRVAAILETSKPRSAKQFLEIIYQVQYVISRQIYNVFAENQLKAIITPGFSVPAIQSGQINKLQYCYGYASGWNVIHYPVGALPVTLVREDQTDFNDNFEDMYTRNMRLSLKKSAGLPVGIQVVSLPHNQQTILYLMDQLQHKIKFRQKHQCPY